MEKILTNSAALACFIVGLCLLRLGDSWETVVSVSATLLNVLTFVLFGVDKGAAQTGRVRVPEQLILVLSALGGSLGVLSAMLLFRHKTRDKTFLPLFAMLLALQALFIACFDPHFYEFLRSQTWEAG